MSEPSSTAESDLSRVRLVSTTETKETKNKTQIVPYIIGIIIFILIFSFGFYLYGKNIAPPPSPIIKNFGITLVSSRNGIAMASGIQQAIQNNGQNCALYPVIVGVRYNEFGRDVNTGWKLTEASISQPNIINLQNAFTGKYPTFQLNLTTNVCEVGPSGLLSLTSANPGTLNINDPSTSSESWFEIITTELNKQITDLQGNTRTVRAAYLSFRSIAQSTPDTPKYLMVGPLFPNFGGVGNTQYYSIIVDKKTSSSDYMFEVIS